MIVIRHMLEGRDPKGIPPTKFNGYFEDPNEVPGSYDVSIRELEDMIQELFTSRTYDELQDITYRYNEMKRKQNLQQKQQRQMDEDDDDDEGGSNDKSSTSYDVVTLQNQEFSDAIDKQREVQRQQLLKVAHQETSTSSGELRGGSTVTPAVASSDWYSKKQLLTHQYPENNNLQSQQQQRQQKQDASTTAVPTALAEHNYDLPDELQTLTPHASTRSELVSDSVERRLLLSYSVFKLNFIVEPPGAEEPTTRAVDPQVYMKYVAGGIGYRIAKNILQDILVSEEPMNPEVIRYMTELALVLQDNEMFRETALFAEGEYFGRPELIEEMKREGTYATQRDLCYSSLMTACGEFIFKKCLIAVLEGEGEGDAVRTAFDGIRLVVPRLPKHLAEPFLRHLEDQAQLMYQDALERRAKYMNDAGGSVREVEQDYLESSAETIVQAATAVLKALVGTGVATVVDKTGALHFEMSCSLFGSLRGLGRTSEACGVAEETMRFYDENREKLKLENDRRHEESRKMLRSASDEDFGNMKSAENNHQRLLGDDANDSAEGSEISRAEETAEDHYKRFVEELEEYELAQRDSRGAAQRRRQKQQQARAVSLEFNHDDPTVRDNSFEFLYRNVYYHYLTDRAKSDPKSGLYNIIGACEKHPKSSEIFRLLCLCLFRLERYDEALKAIDRSILLNPVNPHCHKLRAHVLYKLKEYLTADREAHLANVLHDCWDGLRAPLSPQDVLHATGALLLEADARREALRKQLYENHNGDPNQKPQLPANMDSALQLSQLKDPATGALISTEASQLLSELVSIQLPDTDEELRHYLGQMRRHHIYSKQGPKTPRMRDVKVSPLFDLMKETYGQVVPSLSIKPEDVK